MRKRCKFLPKPVRLLKELLSPGSNAVEQARGNVRRLFRQHGFAVSA